MGLGGEREGTGAPQLLKAKLLKKVTEARTKRCPHFAVPLLWWPFDVKEGSREGREKGLHNFKGQVCDERSKHT